MINTCGIRECVWSVILLWRFPWSSIDVDVLAVRYDPVVDVDQMLLQHPLVSDLDAAHGTTVLRALTALLPFVPDQRLHPPVLFAAGWAKVSAQSLVVVRRVVSWTWKRQQMLALTHSNATIPRRLCDGSIFVKLQARIFCFFLFLDQSYQTAVWARAFSSTALSQRTAGCFMLARLYSHLRRDSQISSYFFFLWKCVTDILKNVS